MWKLQQNILGLFILVFVRESSSHECESTGFTELQHSLQVLGLEKPGGSNELVLKVEEV